MRIVYSISTCLKCIRKFFQENINSGDLSQQLVDLVVASACVATCDKSGTCGLEDKLLLFSSLYVL